MIRRLIILLLIVGCDLLQEEDCAGVAGGNAVIDCAGKCRENVELWGDCYNMKETTILNLSNSGLTGEIPHEIGSLTNLTFLGLSNNQLTGEIPSRIGNLTNLTFLDLSDNQFIGGIPSKVCDLIESNNLNILNITSGNNFTNTCY